jgi:hypothetical protein
MYFNFDKAAIGFALILLYAPICLVKDFERSLLVGATGAILGIALTLLPALWLGAIRWEPKLPDRLWLWSLDNFLVVALTEETLFRGFLQGSFCNCSPLRKRGQCAVSTEPPARQVRMASRAVRPCSMPVSMTEQMAA